jgi:hypothetical protein
MEPPEALVVPPCPGPLGVEEPHPAASAESNTNEPDRREKPFMLI